MIWSAASTGNGVRVEGARYAIGGLFSLPNRGWLEWFRSIQHDRPSWNHLDHDSNLGDQLLLNHVIAGADPEEVHWLTNDRSRIFNLEVGDGLHPFVGDSGLAELRAVDGAVYRDGRRLMLFYWIKRQLDLHVDDGFTSFHPEVRSLLVDLYAGDSPA